MLLYFFIFIWVIVEIIIVRWMLLAKPERKILDKYPRRVIFLSQLPGLFGNAWKNGIENEDLKKMESYQHRITIWYLSILIPFLLIFLFLYIKVLTEAQELKSWIEK
jgi:hypothetical protein